MDDNKFWLVMWTVILLVFSFVISEALHHQQQKPESLRCLETVNSYSDKVVLSPTNYFDLQMECIRQNYSERIFEVN